MLAVASDGFGFDLEGKLSVINNFVDVFGIETLDVTSLAFVVFVGFDFKRILWEIFEIFGAFWRYFRFLLAPQKVETSFDFQNLEYLWKFLNEWERKGVKILCFRSSFCVSFKF